MDCAEYKPRIVYIVVSSVLGVLIALALLWATITAPSRAPVHIARTPPPHRM
jgi:hypothetical protein